MLFKMYMFLFKYDSFNCFDYFFCFEKFYINTNDVLYIKTKIFGKFPFRNVPVQK